MTMLNARARDARPEIPGASTGSLTASVWMQLRRDILAAKLAPGAKLRIADICKLYGAGLSAVREALSRLSSERLVVAEAQRGFRVAPVSRADLLDVTRTRIEVEQLALRHAIAAGDAEWEAGIVAAFHRLKLEPLRHRENPKKPNPGWYELHRRFHRSLIAACGSNWLLDFSSTLYEHTERYRALSLAAVDTSRDVGAEHQALVEATLARDGERAAMLIAAHFKETTRLVLEQFDENNTMFATG